MRCVAGLLVPMAANALERGQHGREEGNVCVRERRKPMDLR